MNEIKLDILQVFVFRILCFLHFYYFHEYARVKEIFGVIFTTKKIHIQDPFTKTELFRRGQLF